MFTGSTWTVVVALPGVVISKCTVISSPMSYRQIMHCIEFGLFYAWHKFTVFIIASITRLMSSRGFSVSVSCLGHVLGITCSNSRSLLGVHLHDCPCFWTLHIFRNCLLRCLCGQDNFYPARSSARQTLPANSSTRTNTVSRYNPGAGPNHPTRPTIGQHLADGLDTELQTSGAVTVGSFNPNPRQ